MRIVVAILLLLSFIFAEQIEITSQKFEGDQKRLLSIFTGNVFMKKGKDIIKAQKVTIYFDKKRKPQKIIAIGKVNFTLYDKNGKYYKGNCDKAIYYPKKKEYHLFGNVAVMQLPDNKKLYSQKLVLNLLTSHVVVEGKGKKPVKMIFEIKE
ncbi:lipopolysaccharide transport periplasmic protein LptA [Nitratiruptor sp. YY09-18]|uniref:lipopolysaccharide transport periplasmic protein LptA n=1 Tax=Nitratiruptor sp. YY09-18 TaxID=2724901 RepID=UPI0019166DB6|nr:lipopolysaccharide transport periplasmic protein LptA [Nitratiruptor sp. YY09-18]BCD67996.1 lipopolysaccharide export system protein LptA [Nitratiruptor sp. YY09-18]